MYCFNVVQDEYREKPSVAQRAAYIQQIRNVRVQIAATCRSLILRKWTLAANRSEKRNHSKGERVLSRSVTMETFVLTRRLIRSD